MSPAELERFEAKYVPVPYSGCWLWDGTATAKHYGRMTMGGRTRMATHLSHEHYIGEVPPGAMVLHTCDVPACVNPEHLSLGTHVENMADMVAKGRQASGDRSGRRTRPDLGVRGERSPASKLTAAAVLRLREDYAAGRGSAMALGRRYGISDSTVGRIARGEKWAHVGGPRTTKGRAGRAPGGGS